MNMVRQSGRIPFAVCAAIFVAATSSAPGAAAETAVLAQDLLKAGASDKAVAAVWTRRADSYTLQVVFDPYRYVAGPAPVRAQPVSTQAESGLDRSSFFIGNSIANLRCLDPAFGGRTLTLVDGRRVVGQPGATAAAPAQAPQAPARPAPRPAPRAEQRPEVQVWLLRTDGTQILPVFRSPATASSGECNANRIADEVLFRFDVAESAQAIAVAMRIGDEYHIEKLQPLEPGAPQ